MNAHDPDVFKIINATLKWAEIRLKERGESTVERLWDEDPEHAVEFVLMQSSPDISHSALLSRLLNGGQPLDAPPPRAHSYPWYSLIEDEVTLLADVFIDFEDNGRKVKNEKRVWICQSPWEIVDTTDEGLIVKYDDRNPLFLLSKSTYYARSISPEAVDGMIAVPGYQMKKINEGNDENGN